VDDALAQIPDLAIDERRTKQLDRRLKTAKAMTFKQCAEAYVKAHAAGWRSSVHARQWRATLETYAYPVLGALPVAAIDTGFVLKVLEPIWSEKTETASRLRGRIETVLNWAVTREYRPEGANPARWKEHLENTLAKPAAAKKVARNGRDEHHAALPYAEIGTFMAELRQQDGVAARALEFAILTAGRTGEVRGARWSEIDLAARVWAIPAERMKKGD
jgi:integrase